MIPNLQMHTITAFYQSRDYADRAADKLRQSGVPASDITVSPETARDEYSSIGSAPGTASTPKRTGFWASLEEMFGDTEDHGTYAEGVRRGNILLTARVTDAQLEPSIVILEEHGSIDLDQHEETWRSEGWTGGGMAASGASSAGATSLAMAGTAPTAKVVTTETAVKAPVLTETVPAVSGVAGVGRSSEDVLQVVEERLNVGKRAVSRGKVRLHTYLVENQVSEDVTLRDETVTVDRRVVDRPIAALGADAFQERTIELEEIGEEAVVGKTARVVEEIGIRKDVSDRTETVRDTVRSTKVDIEDGRTVGTAATGSSSFATRLVKDIEVVGSDGVHVGIIDRVDSGMMKLKRMDPASSGQHHLLPVDLVKSVDGKAMLGIAAAEAIRRWTKA